MTNDREFSDLKLERKECPKCGAIWINGEHRWSGTGNKGNELDLADWYVTRWVTINVLILKKVLMVEILGQSV